MDKLHYQVRKFLQFYAQKFCLSKPMNIILGFELLLMDNLHYHLTVHNPFRSLEGFFIDIKVSTFGEKFANIIRPLVKSVYFSTKHMLWVLQRTISMRRFF